MRQEIPIYHWQDTDHRAGIARILDRYATDPRKFVLIGDSILEYYITSGRCPFDSYYNLTSPGLTIEQALWLVGNFQPNADVLVLYAGLCDLWFDNNSPEETAHCIQTLVSNWENDKGNQKAIVVPPMVANYWWKAESVSRLQTLCKDLHTMNLIDDPAYFASDLVHWKTELYKEYTNYLLQRISSLQK